MSCQKPKNGHETSYLYDALGNVIEVIDALKGKTGCEYDALSRVVKITDALGHEYSCTYDEAYQIRLIVYNILADSLMRNVPVEDVKNEVIDKAFVSYFKERVEQANTISAVLTTEILLASGKILEKALSESSTSTVSNKGESGTNFDNELNFSKKAAEHMLEPGRGVPVQTLQDAIRNSNEFPDPRGSNANMYYTTMIKNGKLYNLEVLYDKATNTVYHFEYTRDAIGNLPSITK